MIERNKTKTLSELAQEHNIGIDSLDYVLASYYGKETIVHRNTLNTWGAVVLSKADYTTGLNLLQRRSSLASLAIGMSSSHDGSDDEIHMRTQEYYNPSTTYYEEQATVCSTALTEIEATQSESPLTHPESAIVLGLLDQLRNISQRALYLRQRQLFSNDCEKDNVMRLEELVENIAELYYGCYFDGVLGDTSRLHELQNFLVNLDYTFTTYRELDNPAEIASLALQILNPSSNRHTLFDGIVDFPQGSMGLGRELNAISRVLRNVPFSSQIIDCHFSSYRRTSSITESIPEHQRYSFIKQKQTLLLCDDNLVSGATLIHAKRGVQALHPDAVVYSGAVELYEEGIAEWQKGNYQYIPLAVLEDVLKKNGANTDDLSRLIGILFREAIFDTTTDLKPVNRDGSVYEGRYLEWKAMLTPQQFEQLEASDELRLALMELFGFQAYSALYEGSFDILDYYPVAPLRIDDLPAYIATLT